MELMDWVALYGAVVATGAAAWDLIKWKKDQAQLTLSCFLAKQVGTLAVPSGGHLHTGTPDPDDVDLTRPRFVAYSVGNTGGRPVVLSSVGGKCKDGSQFLLVGGAVQLPRTIEPGGSVLVPAPPSETPLGEIAEFTVSDAIGREWRSSAEPFQKQLAAYEQARARLAAKGRRPS